MGELRAERAEKRLIRAGETFDSADHDAGLLDFEERVPAPEPAEEPAEPWAMTKPMTPRLRDRVSRYLEHLRRA
jgi:hypothetical protein